MKKITLPITDDVLTSLHAGDELLLTGTIYTARDAAHKRIVEEYKQTKKLPDFLPGSILYYVGPTPNKEGEVIGSAGPTSSYRMDPYSNFLMPLGAKVMIGKGDRTEEFYQTLIKEKGLYMIAIGGLGAKLSKTIKSAEVIMYPDLESEAVRRLEVEDFPVIVACDIHGGNVFKR